jgi:hypothetical protein
VTRAQSDTPKGKPTPYIRTTSAAPVIGYVTLVEAHLLAGLAYRQLGDQRAANQAAEHARVTGSWVMLPHLPGLDHGRMDPAPAHYTIRINGHLGATVLSAFPALAPHHHGAHTVLTGLLDRSALYGVLAEIEALGLDLLEIRKLTPDRESPGPGHHRRP